LLPGSQSNDILHAVESRLQEQYPFQLTEKDPVVIMDGRDESVYAWITANYLLNTICANTPRDTPTYAVLDLGGASTQIVFEPVFTSDARLEEGEHKYDLVFGGKKHILYQHSYL
ncbi:nucleoside phosphatase GDA1/CD39, partial [Macrolepiota fuliginosa MF-IS2]